MTPQAVIFDIGNVLIEWQPERFYDREIGEARRRALFAEVDLHGMNDVIDRGGKAFGIAKLRHRGQGERAGGGDIRRGRDGAEQG